MGQVSMADACVVCGVYVPEGSMVCKTCQAIPKSPCKGCVHRCPDPNCHDECFEYNARKTIHEAYKRRNRLAKEAAIFTTENVKKQMRKASRKVKIFVHKDV